MRIHASSVLKGGVLLIAISLPGCGGRSVDARQFNSAITNANRRLATTSLELGKAIEAAIPGGADDLTRAREQYDEVQQTLADVQEEMKGLTVPDSPAARALHAAHQRFLQGQARLVKDDLAEILRLLADRNLDPATKRARIQAIAKRLAEAEQRDLTPVQEAQRAFAEEQHLFLK